MNTKVTVHDRMMSQKLPMLLDVLLVVSSEQPRLPEYYNRYLSVKTSHFIKLNVIIL